MKDSISYSIKQRIAQKIKEACIEAALTGFENASMSGLCHEGACEAAISAIRNVDIEYILKTNE
ncbi:MAG: acetyltransferase [Pseudomonadota bacterium]